MDSVVEYLVHHAQTQADKTALVVSDERITYGALWERVVSFASVLKRNGVGKGDRVLLHATHSLAYVAAYFSTALLGAAAVPFEESLPQQGVEELAERVKARAALSPFSMTGVDVTFSSEDVLRATGHLDVFDLPAQDDLAELLLTTGTTGRSKIVELTHGAVLAVIQNIATATDIQADNVSLVPMPLNHVFALRRLQTGLVSGATVVLINGVASLKRVLKAIDAYGVTSLSLVPSALAFIERMTKGLLSKYAQQIRFVESSSAPLPSTTRSWLRATLPYSRLYNSYGCTESTACCMLEYSHRDDDGACVGSPCVTALIKILDPVTSERLAEGSGRIAIGGKALMSGYWGDSDATNVTLHDGLVYTNDLGYLRNGELYVQGRIDDVAIIGGHNVSPSEVEDVIIRSNEVVDCACVKGEDSITGDRIVLFAVNGGDADASRAEERLTAFMRAELEPFKIPSHIFWLEQIPRTYNGKIDRKALKKILEDSEDR